MCVSRVMDQIVQGGTDGAHAVMMQPELQIARTLKGVRDLPLQIMTLLPYHIGEPGGLVVAFRRCHSTGLYKD
jgi:hypothetical protein